MICDNPAPHREHTAYRRTTSWSDIDFFNCEGRTCPAQSLDASPSVSSATDDGPPPPPSSVATHLELVSTWFDRLIGDLGASSTLGETKHRIAGRAEGLRLAARIVRDAAVAVVAS